MGQMILNPIRNKETGRVATNVEIVRAMYHSINNLVNPIDPTLSQQQKDEMQDKAYRICGGSKGCEEFLEWSKQIVDETDDKEANRLISRTLMPTIRN